MGKGKEPVTAEPEEVRKRRYKVPEDEGFFAPPDPAEGAVPADVGPPAGPTEKSGDEHKAVP